MPSLAGWLHYATVVILLPFRSRLKLCLAGAILAIGLVAGLSVRGSEGVGRSDEAASRLRARHDRRILWDAIPRTPYQLQMPAVLPARGR